MCLSSMILWCIPAHAVEKNIRLGVSSLLGWRKTGGRHYLTSQGYVLEIQSCEIGQWAVRTYFWHIHQEHVVNIHSGLPLPRGLQIWSPITILLFLCSWYLLLIWISIVIFALLQIGQAPHLPCHHFFFFFLNSEWLYLQFSPFGIFTAIPSPPSGSFLSNINISALSFLFKIAVHNHLFLFFFRVLITI